jgi:hypothetical protein
MTHMTHSPIEGTGNRLVWGFIGSCVTFVTLRHP